MITHATNIPATGSDMHDVGTHTKKKIESEKERIRSTCASANMSEIFVCTDHGLVASSSFAEALGPAVAGGAKSSYRHASVILSGGCLCDTTWMLSPVNLSESDCPYVVCVHAVRCN